MSETKFCKEEYLNHLSEVNRMKIEQFIAEMAKFTDEPGRITRLPFSDSFYCANRYVRQVMSEIGLSVSYDKYGTICGHLEGQIKQSIIIGSHYDTVVNAGKYDGIVGIAVGLAVADHYIRNDITPYYSLDILALNDEEGVRFNNGFLSSKVICGYDVSDYKEKQTNKPLGEFIRVETGGTTENIKLDTLLNNAAQYIEVHIEQGSTLSMENKKIGIVDSIVGIKRATISLLGQSGHAGTTPMGIRSDSLVAASKIISHIPEIMKKYDGAVCTVGNIQNEPNTVNTIPCKTTFSLDIRSSNEETINEIFQEICSYCRSEEISGFPNSVRSMIDVSLAEHPIMMNEKIIGKLESIIFNKSIPYKILSSGAGHDAQIFATKLPTAMIFVPSLNGGISHHPDERSDKEDILRCVDVLIKYVKQKNCSISHDSTH